MKKQLVDQSAHFLIAILICVPFLVLIPYNDIRTILAGALTGFLAGMVREVSSRGDPVTGRKVLGVLTDTTWLGARLDVLFWTIGGGVAGLII